MKNDLSERDDGRNSGVVRLEQSRGLLVVNTLIFRDTRSRDIFWLTVSQS